ncbi:MAG: ammonium transporter [Propionibacteriaceae bacterium]|jgi:Amt family ammonium transporter|nr:ammonium transporter [Propionibacteriaceae bacterium]
MIFFDVSAGDTAWVLISAALVFLMTPGLALFYGGMCRANSALNMMMMCFSTMAIVGVLWVLYGYGIAFGEDVGGGLLGDPSGLFGLTGLFGGGESGAGVLLPIGDEGTLPAMAFVAFQSAFAIITVALISGAVADRMKFSAWMVFAAVWATLVYFPAAHWVFAFDGFAAEKGGWIANIVGAIDYAGGTAIHINAGAAGLVLALVLGKRIGFGQRPMRPHNMTMVMLGAALLWFGWFGFNAGSALGANWHAATVWVTTLAATGAAVLGWLVTERVRDGHFTTLGAASGAVAGLVAITPACSSVSPVGAIAIGVIAGALCCLAVPLKYKLGYDDSLDVVGVHLVGGLVGTLLVGFFAVESAPAGVAGLFDGGGFGQLGRQAVGAFAVLAYSAIVTALIAFALKAIMPIRVDPKSELRGVDLAEHAEVGYDLSNVRYSAFRGGVTHHIVIPTEEKVPEHV